MKGIQSLTLAVTLLNNPKEPLAGRLIAAFDTVVKAGVFAETYTKLVEETVVVSHAVDGYVCNYRNGRIVGRERYL